jgi:hypothetical protein
MRGIQTRPSRGGPAQNAYPGSGCSKSAAIASVPNNAAKTPAARRGAASTDLDHRRLPVGAAAGNEITQRSQQGYRERLKPGAPWSVRLGSVDPVRIQDDPISLRPRGPQGRIDVLMTETRTRLVSCYPHR